MTRPFSFLGRFLRPPSWGTGLVWGPNTENRPFSTPEKAVYLKISVQKASSEKARVEFSTYDKRCSPREINGPAVLIGARRLRIHLFLLKSMHASPSSETCLVVPWRVVLRSFSMRRNSDSDDEYVSGSSKQKSKGSSSTVVLKKIKWSPLSS